MIMNGRGSDDGIRFPFTPAQWQELEQQALIFKYMLSGVPVPPQLLLFTVRRSSSSSSLGDFPRHPTLPSSSSHFGWRCFEMGRKIDPEPGRCRRTDGKKWRCSKEAFQDSKYCDKHMHRGKNRSRKHVEPQVTINTTSSSNSLTPDKPNNRQLFHPPAYSKLDSTTHLGLDSASSYHRYSNSSIHSRSSTEDDNSWQLTPLTMSSSNYKKTSHHRYADSSSGPKLGFESTGRYEDQQHPTVFRFLEERPPEKKQSTSSSSSSWLNMDDRSSTTQLSISIPAATSHHYAFPLFSNSRPQNHNSQT